MAAARARVTRQIDTARAVSAAIADTDAPGPGASKPAIGTVGHGASQVLTASVRAADNRLVVLVLDTSQLAAWVGAWSTDHASFDIALARGTDARVEGAVLATPLFAESSLFHLVIRARALDPATDRRRQRLFVAAVVAGLTLTLLLGYVALRDVSRELRTAALRSTFVAGVTHELKTPLASIRLLAETLRWGRARPEAAGDLLDTIVEEADRLGRLVDNVLSSSQIESGMRVYHPRMVSLSEAVRDALRRFDYVLKKEGFTVVKALDGDAAEVHADPEALGQALLNLLGNAVKYSGLSREIRVRVSREGGGARVSVEDDGIGMPPGEHARVFDSFYRAPETATHTAGAGLGLALVRHFAEAHGGHVHVTSQSGRGSAFSVWLPLADAGHRPYG
jgi:two-component system phosphate regulon sensor histidine kinase PhoR